MIRVRAAEDRGHVDSGGLHGRHSFSFGDYHDPEHMGVSDLRVINDDYLAPGAGFPTHGHRDMEIVTVVLEGEMAHADSLGNGSTIQPDDVQVMSAGRGVQHSEFNASETARSHSLQIWLFPHERGVEPRYDQARFDAVQQQNRLKAIVSGDGRDGSLVIGQNAALYRCRLGARAQVVHTVPRPRAFWVQVLSGTIEVAGTHLFEGDGARIDDEYELVFHGVADADFLLFDLREE